jgi:hypothetical protein
MRSRSQTSLREHRGTHEHHRTSIRSIGRRRDIAEVPRCRAGLRRFCVLDHCPQRLDALHILGPILSRPTVLKSSAGAISKIRCKDRRRRPGSEGRVLATGNEAAHRAHSGNPALRRPSISSFEFDCHPPRAIHADIVKAGSSSSRRAAASRASASRPRWAKADARQR